MNHSSVCVLVVMLCFEIAMLGWLAKELFYSVAADLSTWRRSKQAKGTAIDHLPDLVATMNSLQIDSLAARQALIRESFLASQANNPKVIEIDLHE